MHLSFPQQSVERPSFESDIYLKAWARQSQWVGFIV
jgi:hypothetical protein